MVICSKPHMPLPQAVTACSGSPPAPNTPSSRAMTVSTMHTTQASGM